MSSKPVVLVCAIDFGTTFTGYAFSFTENKNDIRMYKDWGSCMSLKIAHRTPTCLLTTRNGTEVVKFGYEAQHEYINMDPNDAREYSFYEKFKMNLYTKKAQKQIYIADKFGESTSLSHLFAMGLRYLSTHMFSQVEKQTIGTLNSDQIRWVITVPAIWSDASKQFMRKAAKEAGIIEEVDSHNLVIALEPEAASLYCRQLHVNHPGSTEPRLPPGTNYLVMDCGGGTLDVTVHHLRSEDEVAELYQATGSDLGGTKVDANFVQLLRQVFGEDFVDAYQDESPGDYLNFLTNFQQAKKTVSPSNNQTTNLVFTFEFGRIYQEVSRRSVKDALSDEWKKTGMRISGGHWRIPQATMLGLFEPVVRGIVEHMKGLMSVAAVKKVTHLLLVGGFAESEVLQQTVKTEFGQQMKIIIPDDASLCVMKGATMFGHSPSSVVVRRAKNTYGTDVYPKFDAGKHDPTKTKMYGDTRRAEGVFRTLAKKGEEITGSKTFTHRPILEDQSNIVIGLYCSSSLEPQYISDPDVEYMSDVTVQLPGSGLDRQVEVKICFGGTEMTVEARDCRPGGHAVKTTVNYKEN